MEPTVNNQRPTRDTMSVEEATISNLWEMAAVVEVLERKGLCAKQDLQTNMDDEANFDINTTAGRIFDRT